MNDSDYWGELRSKLKGPQTREAFVTLWRWLGENPGQIQREEVRGYLRDHLLDWPQDSRVLWADELEAPLDRFKLWLRLLQPRIEAPSPLRTHMLEQPALLDTPHGAVSISSTPGDRPLHLDATYAGCCELEGAACWAWEHDDWSGQIQTFTQNARDQWVHGSALVCYKLLAHTAMPKHTITARWHPLDEEARLVPNWAEHFEAQVWSETLEEEAGWQHQRENLAPPRALCIGTNTDEAMIEHAGDWWPGNRDAGLLNFPANALEVSLSKMKPEQRIKIWFAITWGVHPQDQYHHWFAASDLLQRCAEFAVRS